MSGRPRLKSKDTFVQPIIPTKTANDSDDKINLPTLQLKVSGSVVTEQDRFHYPSSHAMRSRCTNGNLTNQSTNLTKLVSGKAPKENKMIRNRVHHGGNGEWFHALGRPSKQKAGDDDRMDLEERIFETHTLPIHKFEECGFHSTRTGLQNEKMKSEPGYDSSHDVEATLHGNTHNSDHQTEVDPAHSDNLKHRELERPGDIINIPEHVGENISTMHSIHHSQLPSSCDTIHDSAQQFPRWDECSTSNFCTPSNDMSDCNRNMLTSAAHSKDLSGVHPILNSIIDNNQHQQENQKMIVNASEVIKELSTAFCSNSCETFSVSVNIKPIETETENVNEPNKKVFHNMKVFYSAEQGKGVIES